LSSYESEALTLPQNFPQTFGYLSADATLSTSASSAGPNTQESLFDLKVITNVLLKDLPFTNDQIKHAVSCLSQTLERDAFNPVSLGYEQA